MQLLTSCCGMRLRTGGLVLGYLTIGSLPILLIISAVAFYFLIFILEDAYLEKIRITLIILANVVFICLSIELAISILFVVGIKKERHLFLLPFIISIGISLFGLTAMDIMYLSMMLSNAGGILEFLVITIMIGFWVYVFYAMISLFEEMKKNRETQGVQQIDYFVDQ